MLAEFTAWLWSLLVEVFSAAWGFVQDSFVNALDLLVSGFASLVASIPVPSFMAGGLGAVFGGLDSGVLWLLTQAGLPQALGILGAGYAFRLARKFFTLFQW
ncbi:MAG: hypothetical protein DI563_04840 [Variovorax paradoxus]|uniref:Minor coat protein n=1 Tax=Variovorax paradoxus TaxID=34073 RepID=A0A2W5QQD4_VARPD|nr:MAG: hypothetical protein DI563_04840 [Variovorax paradoxus]